MRYRSTVTGGFTTPIYREQRSRSCGGTWPAWSPLSTTYIGERCTKEIWDVEIPGFHALRRCGSYLPINPVTITTTTEKRSTGYISRTSRPSSCSSGPTNEQRGECWYSYPATIVPPAVNDAKVTSVVNSAIAGVRSATWDVLTTLAELGDIPRAFRSSLDGINKLAMKAAFKAKSRADFEQYWLTYRYGWMPLIFTVQDAIKAFNEPRLGMLREKTGVTEPINVSNNRVVNTGDAQYTIIETLTGSRRYGGMAYMEADGLVSDFGVNPLVTAWERVPYSFVIDWFFQVGTWLDATSTNWLGGSSPDIVSGYSIKTDYKYVYNSYIQYLSVSGQITSGGGPVCIYESQVSSYERGPRGASLPGWNPRITPERLLDAVSLVLASKSRVLRELVRR